MSHALPQKLGMGLLANRLADPGAAGTIRVPADQSYVVLVATNSTGAGETRYIADAAIPGQALMVVNNTAYSYTIVDAYGGLQQVAALLTLESALLVYTGLDSDPWHAVVFKQSAT